MPFLYLYAVSDFTTGLPNEAGGAAQGTPIFSITLAPGATSVAVEVDDTDGQVDEITGTGSQTFTNAVTLGTASYPAGTSYHGAYDLINTATGHKVTSLTLGGDGTEQGPVQALLSSIPLVAGTTYTFNSERSSYLRTDNTYDSYEDVPCFTKGTLINTSEGVFPIETLRTGDMVYTHDHGYQKIKWIGCRKLSCLDLERAPHLLPIRISAHALGPDLPTTDLLVSPQHRVLVRSKIAMRVSGEKEVLIAAKHLTERDGICVEEGLISVTYYHFLFENHELVIANGTLVESLYTGKQALKAISPEARAEIFEIFPELVSLIDTNRLCRPSPTGRAAKKIAFRHQKNDRPLVEIELT